MAKKMYTREELHMAESNARLTQIARSATMMQGYVNRIAELEAENAHFDQQRHDLQEINNQLHRENEDLKTENKLLLDRLGETRLRAETFYTEKMVGQIIRTGDDGMHARVKVKNPSNGVYDKYWQAGSNVIWRIEWCPRCLYTVTVDAVDLPNYELDWNILLNEAMIHVCVKAETVTHRMVGAGHGLLGGFDYTFYCPDCLESLCYDVGIADTYGNTKEFRDMLYEAFNHTHEDD